MLPVISYTSRLNDREMLVILAVIFFGLISFLILDALSRISTHTRQLKVLTQEVALLRENIAASGKIDLAHRPIEPIDRDDSGILKGQACSMLKGYQQAMLALWIVLCLGIYIMQMYPSYPLFLKRFFSAKYLE